MSTADQAISALTKIAAECHRAKWQFDVNTEFRLTAAEARVMVPKAFDELHRIGDKALELRDQIRLNKKKEPVT